MRLTPIVVDCAVEAATPHLTQRAGFEMRGGEAAAVPTRIFPPGRAPG